MTTDAPAEDAVNRRGPLDAMSERNRHWLLVLIALGLASFVVQAVLGFIVVSSIYTNRNVGNGNRVVSCATLHKVAPDLQLRECPTTTR